MLSNTLNPADPKQLISQNADHCVMCGMCLPHCPTYRLYRTEAESPRGRIALMNALAQGRLQADTNTQTHLNHCLGCMACEAVCPSKVPYGLMRKQTQESFRFYEHQGWLIHKMLNASRAPGGVSRYSKILPWFKYLGLNKVFGYLATLASSQAAKKIHTLLDAAQSGNTAAYYPATTHVRGDVTLFTGCMGNLFDIETLNSSVTLLTRLGYNVHIPADQYCCGALHEHHGDMHTSNELTKKNREVFNKTGNHPLISISSACGAQLRQHPAHIVVTDILEFLHKNLLLDNLEFRPLPYKILIHESCSARNQSKSSGLARKTLDHIPDIDVKVFSPDNQLCCGAGGSHQIMYPAQANSLLNFKIVEIMTTHPRALVTDNLACALHFKSGFLQQNIAIEVMHPVTLLARQLSE
jgi:glycolate oxidase iron-sulfur subunit